MYPTYHSFHSPSVSILDPYNSPHHKKIKNNKKYKTNKQNKINQPSKTLQNILKLWCVTKCYTAFPFAQTASFLSFSLYFWLISWNAKAGFLTQEILASLLSLSHRRLQTTRFWSIKGPHQVAPRTGAWNTWQIRVEWLEDLSRSVSTKTWVKRLESPITLLLYFITYLKFRDFQFHVSE